MLSWQGLWDRLRLLRGEELGWRVLRLEGRASERRHDKVVVGEGGREGREREGPGECGWSGG